MLDVVKRLQAALAGRYVIERELGHGATATVYLAHDVQHGRDVALKVLVPELATALTVHRFLREIATAARLQHPHILSLHASGDADGLPYFVMPYVEGETLRDRLRREQQLPLDDALRIAREVADGLGYAHSLGVIHRDIKPENILLSGGHAVVADFGIARAITEAADDRLTGTGLAIGTPAYMSPEQASGREEVDARSDIYALGCVLYEMLAGTPPFTGPTTQAILARHSVDVVPALRTVRTVVPRSIESAIERALAKVPADRFATAASFAQALDPTAEEPLEPRIGVQAPANSIAVLSFNDLSQDRDLEYLCDGMAEQVINALATVPGLHVVSRTSSFALKGRRLDIREIGRRLRVGAVIEGSVRSGPGERLEIRVILTDVGSGYQRWSKPYDRSLADLFAAQEEIARDLVNALKVRSSEDRPASRGTDNVDAYRLYLRGRHFWNKRFEGGLQKGIAAFEEALELDPFYARPYAGLADAFLALGTYEFLSPLQALPKAIAASRKALELDDTVAEAHASLGLATMYFRHDWAAAEQSFSRAIELDAEYAPAHQFYSILLAARGRLDEAVKKMRRAHELDPLSPIMEACVGWMLYFAGRNEEAIEAFLGTLKSHPAFGIARGMLGQAYLEVGKFDRAIEELAECARTFPPAAGALGYAYGVAGKPAEAREALAALERRKAQAYVSPYGPAIIYAGLDERDLAFEWLSRSYEEQSTYIVLLNVNPMFRRLREDERFAGLREKVRLQ